MKIIIKNCCVGNCGKRKRYYSKNSVVLNALEELLNEKESKSMHKFQVNRWQLTSNVDPVFLGSILNGFPVDSTFSKNSKSYNTNVGFGIGVSYAVNKKPTFRTGLNKMNLSYDTNDFLFFTGLQVKYTKNITPKASSRMIQIESASNRITNSTSTSELLPFKKYIFYKK